MKLRHNFVNIRQCSLHKWPRSVHLHHTSVLDNASLCAFTIILKIKKKPCTPNSELKFNFPSHHIFFLFYIFTIFILPCHSICWMFIQSERSNIYMFLHMVCMCVCAHTARHSYIHTYILQYMTPLLNFYLILSYSKWSRWETWYDTTWQNKVCAGG